MSESSPSILTISLLFVIYFDFTQSIQDFIETAEDKVILFAFGSNMDFSKIPKHLEDTFFETFRQFPKISFIVKASGSRPKHCPENLLYEKWVPQKEVLG